MNDKPTEEKAKNSFDLKSRYITLDKLITWDDIKGLEEAKLLMKEAIELPYLHPETFSYYNKRIPKGILLYGPAGCGKTLLGKAAASSLNKKGVPNFLYIKGPEILDMWLGNSEKNVRDLFTEGREFKKQHGYPLVIFLDEADALLASRNTPIAGKHASQTGIINTFLAEMDGLEESGAFLILATNKPESLDPAVTREGRIDRKIKITRPDRRLAMSILYSELKKIPAQEDKKHLIKFTLDEIFSPARCVTQVGNVSILLSHTLSGALLVGLVDYATTIAIRRDLRNKSLSGLCRDDIKEGLSRIVSGMKDLDYNHILEEIAA